MGKYVVVGGASVGNPELVKKYIEEDDFVVYCDCGLRHAEMLGRAPDLIVADFDSSKDPKLEVETIVLPHEKDDTDTAFAVKEGIRRGFEEFLLVGVIGERFDHSLGNVQLLYMLDKEGKKAMIVDDYSEMIVISDSAEVTDEFAYFSLLNISGTAEGITITGAKYNLRNAQLTPDFPLGVSNEPAPGQTARISVSKGKLLLIRDRV